MKTILQKYLKIESLIIILILFLCGTQSSESASLSKSVEQDTLQSSTWVLHTLNGNDVVKEKAGNEIPYLVLNLIENIVSGSTGCNKINGKITVTADEIKFSEMSMTKMFCADAEYETDFVSALFDSSVKYKIENSNLTFFKQDKAVMSFVKKPLN